MTYPGRSLYFLPPDRFRPLGVFRLFSTQALSTARPKAIREKSFLPHLIARKGVDCTDGGNGSHDDA
jgi:hypothetical protein